MDLDTLIGSFLNGLKHTFLQTSVFKEILSSAIRDGIESGLNRMMSTLIKNIALGAVFFTGIFLVGIGIAKWIEAVFITPGTGFIFIGIVFLLAASAYLHLRN